MVRHAAHFTLRYFPRPDIESAVHLPRIGRDDLAIESARDLDPQGALTRCCRADDDQDFFHTVTLLYID